jgi:Secretion system C-terminal sorting domain
MKKLLLILLLLLAKSKSVAQVTIIPDNRFEQALIDLGIDSDLTINGQILTSDALLVTQLELSPNSLTNYPYSATDFYDGLIHDLSGLEAFVNIERLEIHVTMVEDLNINSLINLKYLDCVDNMLTAVHVSNNPLLEYINVTNGGDVLPFNNIVEIDLSNNPNIKTIFASGVKMINLNNNNNNPNTVINVYCSFCFDLPENSIVGNACIKVDNVELAQNNQAPYSSWTVNHNYISLNYADDLIQCSLSNTKFNRDKIAIYPNPVSSGIVNLQSTEETNLKVEIFDFLGRKILEKDQVKNTINISQLKKGNYLMKLMSDKGIQTEKLIVE